MHLKIQDICCIGVIYKRTPQ